MKYPWQEKELQRREARRPKPKTIVFKNKASVIKAAESGNPLKKLLLKCIFHFHAFIRNRDRFKGCITCGAPVTEAGHYYSAGKFNALRFNEDNVNGQCTECNCFKSGNLKVYREALLLNIGKERISILDNISCETKVHKYEFEELQVIYEKYKISKK